MNQSDWLQKKNQSKLNPEITITNGYVSTANVNFKLTEVPLEIVDNDTTLVKNISENEPLKIKPNFISIKDLVLRGLSRRFLVDFVGQVVDFKLEECRREPSLL